MKTIYFVLALAMVFVGAGAQAATDMYLTDSSGGVIDGDGAIDVLEGATVTLYAYLVTTDAGNNFTAMVGYDTTNSGTYGTTATAATGKMTLVGTTTDVLNTINAVFTASKSVQFAGSREAVNSSLGGRPWGLAVNGLFSGSATFPSGLQLFSLTLTNNMVGGQSSYVVLSNAGSGTNYTTMWKGISTYRDGYALRINSIPVPEPSALIGLGTGVMALAGFAVRRRR